MTFVSAYHGLVTVEDDVLGIKRQIVERWPSLDVILDKDRLVWMIIENCENGDQKLCFETKSLDHRVFDRIEAADQHSPNAVDFFEAMQKHNDELERDRDRRFYEQIGDFGERFMHALKKDGVRDHEDIYGNRLRRPSRILNR
jgi:hypothetical protein